MSKYISLVGEILNSNTDFDVNPYINASISQEKQKLYSIILPTYNERENLPLIFYLIDQTFAKQCPNARYEVIVVEDNSPDNTLEVAESIQKTYGSDKMKILSRKGKLGLGTAYVSGLDLCEGDYVILMDADLSHHPKFIVDMINVMNADAKVDIVCGTRYSKGGGVAGWDWYVSYSNRKCLTL